MGKPKNAWQLPRADHPTKTRTFVDPRLPEEPFTFSLRRPGTFELAGIRERTQALTVEYVTGLVDADGNLVRGADREPVKPPTPFAGVGERVDLNRTMVAALAMLAGIQSPVTEKGEPNEERYAFEELVPIALRARFYGELSHWAAQFVPGEDEPGNSETASGDSSSAPPSSD